MREKLKSIAEFLNRDHHDTVVKEACTLLEVAMKDVVREALVRLPLQDRLKLQDAEREIGKGAKGFDHFGLSQLVGLFQATSLWGRWAQNTGLDLGLVQSLNLASVVALRNRATHEGTSCTRGHAQFVFDYVKIVLTDLGRIVEGDLDEEPPERDGSIAIIDRHRASEIFHRRLADPSVRNVVIVTYTNEVEAGSITKYSVQGPKRIEIYKRSILRDLAEQQVVNIRRLVNRPDLRPWAKHKTSRTASEMVRRESASMEGVEVEEFFYEGSPTRRAFVFDWKEAIVSHYQTHEDALAVGGSIYKGMADSPRVWIHDDTPYGRYMLDELRHLVHSMRLHSRDWDAERAALDNPVGIYGLAQVPCVNPRGVFLDLDGVIYDSLPMYVDAWRQAFAVIGMSIPDELVYMHEGRSNEGTVEQVVLAIAGRSATPDEVRKVVDRKREVYGSMGKAPIQKGARELIEAIRVSGLPFAIVTGSTKPGLLQHLEDDFGTAIDGKSVVRASDVTFGKPHPEPYLRAIGAAGIPPASAIAIENGPLGVESAVRAGAFCLTVNTGILEDHVLARHGARNILRGCEELAKHWPGILQVLVGE